MTHGLSKIRRRPRTRARLPRSAVVTVGACVLATLLGCMNREIQNPPMDRPPETQTEEISALEESISRDRRTLEDLITRQREGDTQALHLDTELREIIDRMMAQTKRLDLLREESGRAPHSS